jgi:Tol biopolymer transport system component
VIEDTELREILRATAEHADLPTAMPQPLRRKVRLRRARTMGVAFLTAAVVFVGGLQGMRAVTTDEAAPKPAGPDAEETKVTVMIDHNIRVIRPTAAAPKVPYVIDLTTQEMTPLPEAITGLLVEGGQRRFWNSRFAASPDGSSLAFVGEGEDGSPQIYTADPDGTDLRLVTNDPTRAASPAWSPDGTKIVYDGYGSGDNLNLFVLDLATGESTQITHESESIRCFSCSLDPQFTPDGSSIIYTLRTRVPASPERSVVVRTVPVAGGKSTILVGPGKSPGGLNYWAGASMSPDGSVVTFVGSGYVPETLPDGAPRHCDRCRFLIDVDGTDARIIFGWNATPSGAWSPDSTRIVMAGDSEPPFASFVIVDAATGETSRLVADARYPAIWVGDHTLLVDV